MLVDKTFSEIRLAMSDLTSELILMGDKGERVLLSSYYSGHGLEDAKGTLIILDEDGEKKGLRKYANYIFNLEECMKGKTDDHVYTISFFDCCR